MRLIAICLMTFLSLNIQAQEGSELKLNLNSRYLNFPVSYDEDDNTNIVVMYFHRFLF